MQSVEVTGRGVVSSAGQDVATFSQAVLAGTVQIAAVENLPAPVRFSHGAPVKGFEPLAHFDERTLGMIDRFTQFAAVAARQAVAESGLVDAGVAPERIGVVIGTANAGIDILQEGFVRVLSENLRPRPLTVPMTMGSAPASRIARETGARGPAFGVTSACASAGHAIQIGLMLMRSGVADAMIVGGTESCFCDGYLQAWDALRVVSSDTCRPFSINRKGLVIGEGAAILVLEKAGAAAKRGRRPIARLAGAGMSSDAADLTLPDPSGMASAMRQAVADAGAAPADVAYVNAHGTGTAANDKAECQAVKMLFGDAPPLVSSTKSMIGHAMGASGALEALATIAAIERGIVPPTMNFLGADPQCDLDVVPNAPVTRAVGLALSNSFAFGGLNVSLAFAHPDR